MNQVCSDLSQWFRPEALVFPRYSLNEKLDAVRLHQNETHAVSREERIELISALEKELRESDAINIYPKLHPARLLAAYAAELDIDESNLEVTAGSSQALTLIAEALFGAGRKVAITSPSFSLYASLVRLHGAEVVDISLNDDFCFEPQSLFSEQVLAADCTIICSPNNPTGTVMPFELIAEFSQVYKGMLIIDEAYFEFYEAQGGRSCIPLAIRRPNVIVLRTLSKAWAAAGLRIGAIIARADVVEIFRSLKPPYSIAWPSEIMATHVLREKSSLMRERSLHTVQNVRSLSGLLRNLRGVALVTDSMANFVFFKTDLSATLDSELQTGGFLPRRYGTGRLQNCMRLSMPSDDKFESLKSILTGVLS